MSNLSPKYDFIAKILCDFSGKTLFMKIPNAQLVLLQLFGKVLKQHPILTAVNRIFCLVHIVRLPVSMETTLRERNPPYYTPTDILRFHPCNICLSSRNPYSGMLAKLKAYPEKGQFFMIFGISNDVIKIWTMLNKTSKFKWMLDNIRIVKIISTPIWVPVFFSF